MRDIYSSTQKGQWECHLGHNNSYKTILSQSTWQTGMATPILCIAANKVMNTKLYMFYIAQLTPM